MRTQISKYSIKIPYGITIIYNKKIQILIVIGPFKKKSLKLKLKVFIDQSKKILSVSPVSLDQISNTERKKINILRNTTLINIKQMLIESRVLVHKKLKINGIGYRAIIAEKFNNRLLTLNLGFSHSLYVKIPKNLKTPSVVCFCKISENVSCVVNCSHAGRCAVECIQQPLSRHAHVKYAPLVPKRSYARRWFH